MALQYAVYDTKVGDVTIVSHGKYLVSLFFGSHDPIGAINEENVALYDAIIEINKYFNGERFMFSNPIQPLSMTEFDKKVYEYVLSIPYAETRTYSDVAEAIGEPNAEKQVTNVLAKNPLPLFIPCHRVVGKNGNPGVYPGSLELKRKIINFEKELISKDTKAPAPSID